MFNREFPGYCGTYTAAALAHYVIQKVYERKISMDDLIIGLKPRIDGRFWYKGTYPWDLIGGLKALFEDVDYKQM